MSDTRPLTTAGQDTIAALATPPGTSGIAVLRCSGEKAVSIAAEIFEGPAITKAASHTVHHGKIIDEDACIIDEVLVTVFRTPRSYTGEDSIEISCHGGMVIAQRVLSRLLHAGARHAEPGEFTRRAFLNGKMDLAQAEAVADLIHAQSEEARRASVSQLEGSLSRYVSDIRKQLLNAASMLELSLDFVEEDVAFLSADELNALIADALEQMTAALASFRSGRLIRDGVRVALLGPPNVGKSSLLNALLGTQRAIVTDVPGTTRDYIEEQMLLHGEYFRFVDTAGLRETADHIEQKGIAISRSILEQADIICAVTDAREGSAAMTDFEAKLRQEDTDAVVLQVFNKADLVKSEETEVLNRSGIAISALHGNGMEALITRLSDRARSLRSTSEKGTILVTNVRHADCLKRGIHALNEARRAGTEGKTEEFLAYEVRIAIDALGAIIGEVTTNDILNGIFARFCIGK